jgi:ABC-2 type transport system ATP-binding protein
MTRARQALLIEVDEGAERLLAELGRRGLEPRTYERALLVRLDDDGTYDAVRDAIADLGLPLNRLEQRRRRVEELFRDDQAQDSEAPEASHVG